MRRLMSLSAAALLALTALARAGGLSCLCNPRCKTPPPPCCPDCSGPCEHRLCLALCGPEHTDKYLQQLTSENYCERRHAARKLGCRWHADFCTDPRVMEALVAALQCDPCWEVRYEAAWAFRGQDARTTQGLLALYISSKLDPHYQVRTRAAEALDILTVGRRDCYKGLYLAGDKLIAELRANKYVPGHDNCRVLWNNVCTALPPPAPAKQPASGPAEELPPPRENTLPEKLPLPRSGS